MENGEWVPDFIESRVSFSVILSRLFFTTEEGKNSEFL